MNTNKSAQNIVRLLAITGVVLLLAACGNSAPLPPLAPNPANYGYGGAGSCGGGGAQPVAPPNSNSNAFTGELIANGQVSGYIQLSVWYQFPQSGYPMPGTPSQVVGSANLQIPALTGFSTNNQIIPACASATNTMPGRIWMQQGATNIPIQMILTGTMPQIPQGSMMGGNMQYGGFTTSPTGTVTPGQITVQIGYQGQTSLNASNFLQGSVIVSRTQGGQSGTVPYIAR